MAKQASRNPRTSQSRRASQSRADEIRSLKASLTDLQSKRFSALRLYQEEKTQRQKEAARASELSSQLEKLENSSLGHPRNPSNPTNIVTTDTFVAELRGLSLAPSAPFASLTWHCLGMPDILAGPPDVLAVLHPTAAIPDSSTSVEDASKLVSIKDDAPAKRRPLSMHEVGHRIPLHVSEDIENLTNRLRQLEAEAEAAKRSVHDNQRLVCALKSQLDASTAARKDLMLTLKEQRETIERLS